VSWSLSIQFRKFRNDCTRRNIRSIGCLLSGWPLVSLLIVIVENLWCKSSLPLHDEPENSHEVWQLGTYGFTGFFLSSGSFGWNDRFLLNDLVILETL